MAGKTDQVKGQVKRPWGASPATRTSNPRARPTGAVGEAKEKLANAKDKVEEVIDKAEEKVEEVIDKAKDALHRK